MAATRGLTGRSAGPERSRRDPPRLLYIGDVPVEPTVAGAALIYRLLEGYPADRLAVCQSDLADPRRRAPGLPGVRYSEFPIGFRALLHSRAAGVYAALVLARASGRVSTVEHLHQDVPDAVVTIAHGFTWRTASAYARRHRLPLHLIVHDDPVETTGVTSVLRPAVERQFREVYVAAASRLCVSPTMEQHYRSTLGVPGSVIYPTRARDARPAGDPAPRLRQRSGPFTIAFAGSLNSGHFEIARRLAGWLDRTGGRLEIYGAMVDAGQAWSRSQSVSFQDYVPSDRLPDVLRERADALLVPMPFDAHERLHTILGFPSKIADYTAMGLPVLIVGPSYSSAVVWSEGNPGAAAVVHRLDDDSLDRTLDRLARDAEWRWQLATEALRAGDRHFSHARGQGLLFDALRGTA